MLLLISFADNDNKMDALTSANHNYNVVLKLGNSKERESDFLLEETCCSKAGS